LEIEKRFTLIPLKISRTKIGMALGLQPQVKRKRQKAKNLKRILDYW
jgi:hypothetical protein